MFSSYLSGVPLGPLVFSQSPKTWKLDHSAGLNCSLVWVWVWIDVRLVTCPGWNLTTSQLKSDSLQLTCTGNRYVIKWYRWWADWGIFGRLLTMHSLLYILVDGIGLYSVPLFCFYPNRHWGYLAMSMLPLMLMWTCSLNMFPTQLSKLLTVSLKWFRPVPHDTKQAALWRHGLWRSSMFWPQ